VVARVKALMRRISMGQQAEKASEDLVYLGLTVQLNNKKVLLNGKEIAFTKKEFEILRLFLENRNRVFTRDEILTRVWSDEVIVLDRTIDVNITRLRKKIGDYGRNIVTRLGYGYCFEE
jgi:DNA-binding response OmpR family regulator